MTINAINGLANRILTIAAAKQFADEAGLSGFKVVWHHDAALNADFHELFEPLPQSIEVISPPDLSYALKWEIPRLRNVYLSAIYQRLSFDKVLSDPFGIRRMGGWGESLCDAVKSCGESLLIISGSGGAIDASSSLRELFIPIAPIRQTISEVVTRFQGRTVGVHIRRTDNAASIAGSPLEAFFKVIDETSPDTIFTATDDVESLEAMKMRYGSRIITIPQPDATRSTLAGIRAAVTDLWCLSKTDLVIGSCQSSFSLAASRLGGIPLTVASL